MGFFLMNRTLKHVLIAANPLKPGLPAKVATVFVERADNEFNKDNLKEGSDNG